VSYETRVLALFEEANPVPETESMAPDVEPAIYLATLRTRSSEMTQLDTNNEIVHRPRQNLGWVLAAVAAVIAGVVAIIMSQGTAETPPVITVPPTVATTLAELTETTLSAEEAAWIETKVLLSSTPIPGLYRTDKFTPEFKFEVTPGWKPAEIERPHLYGLTTSSDWDTSTDVGPSLAVYLVKPEADSIEDAVSIFTTIGDTGGQAAATGTVVGEESPTSIGGADGVKFEMDTESFRFGLMGRADSDSPGVFFDGDKLYEVHVVDVDGEIVTAVVQAPPEFFEDFKDRARTLFDSVIWRGLD